MPKNLEQLKADKAAKAAGKKPAKKSEKKETCKDCGHFLDASHTAAMCQMQQNIFHASMQ